MADFELVGYVGHSNLKSRCLTENVINYNGGACLGVKNNTTIVSKVLPNRVKVMDEYNEDDRAVNKAEGYNSVSIPGVIRTCNSQFNLG